MEMRFSASVIEAISYVLGVLSGRKTALPRGTQFSTPDEMLAALVTLPRPCWCNFDFFSRIDPSPIRRVERVDPTEGSLGWWELEREVEFYHAGHIVARVQLVGRKIDKSGHLDNSAFWGVSRITYCLTSGSGAADPRAKGWCDFECETLGLTSRPNT
jgi:hypothetical protein